MVRILEVGLKEVNDRVHRGESNGVVATIAFLVLDNEEHLAEAVYG